LVILQPSKGAFRPPLAAYQAQDLSGLASRLPRFRTRERSRPLMPAVRLDMVTIRNGWFAIGDRLDGLVLTEDRYAVRETMMFTRLADRSVPQRPIDLPPAGIVLDDVFLGFDGGWVNWYHWLCFALGRSAIAAGFLSERTQIVLPEYSTRQPVGFSADTWMQSIGAFGLAGKERFLPPGLYRADNRPSRVEQGRRTPSRMRVVEYHPGVVMLGRVGALAHVEPADPVRQYHDGRERRSRHRLGSATPGDPLQPHQQGELALDRGGQRQRMAQKAQHRIR
jgi:hypothetical protein